MCSVETRTNNRKTGLQQVGFRKEFRKKHIVVTARLFENIGKLVRKVSVPQHQ